MHVLLTGRWTDGDLHIATSKLVPPNDAEARGIVRASLKSTIVWADTFDTEWHRDAVQMAYDFHVKGKPGSRLIDTCTGYVPEGQEV